MAAKLIFLTVFCIFLCAEILSATSSSSLVSTPSSSSATPSTVQVCTTYNTVNLVLAALVDAVGTLNGHIVIAISEFVSLIGTTAESVKTKLETNTVTALDNLALTQPHWEPLVQYVDQTKNGIESVRNNVTILTKNSQNHLQNIATQALQSIGQMASANGGLMTQALASNHTNAKYCTNRHGMAISRTAILKFQYLSDVCLGTYHKMINNSLGEIEKFGNAIQQEALSIGTYLNEEMEYDDIENAQYQMKIETNATAQWFRDINTEATNNFNAADEYLRKCTEKIKTTTKETEVAFSDEIKTCLSLISGLGPNH